MAIYDRSVPESQKAYAMGVSTAILRLGGNIPGPILIGAFIDQSCLLWDNSCGSSTTCWIYDSKKMGIYLTLSLVAIKLLSTFCFLLSWWFYRKESTESQDLQNFTLERKDIAADVNFI